MTVMFVVTVSTGVSSPGSMVFATSVERGTSMEESVLVEEVGRDTGPAAGLGPCRCGEGTWHRVREMCQEGTIA